MSTEINVLSCKNWNAELSWIIRTMYQELSACRITWQSHFSSTVSERLLKTLCCIVSVVFAPRINTLTYWLTIFKYTISFKHCDFEKQVCDINPAAWMQLDNISQIPTERSVYWAIEYKSAKSVQVNLRMSLDVALSLCFGVFGTREICAKTDELIEMRFGNRFE